MTVSVVIEPNAICDDAALYCALGISATTLAKARRNGSLRYTRKGNRILYLGQWILDWLSSGDEQEVPT